MNLILLITIVFFPRPDCPPLTAADINRVYLLEEEFENWRGDWQPVSPPATDALAGAGTATQGHRCRKRHYGTLALPIPGRFVIGFQEGKETAIITAINNLNGVIKTIAPAAGFIVIELPLGISLQQLQVRLQSVPGVRFIEPDYPVQTLLIPNDPLFLTKQWDKWVMYADQAWDITTGGTIKVALLDNGVDYTHPDLAANFRPDELGYDFINGDNDPRPDNPTIPNAFHGTHVAGIIAAVANNGTGIAGWAQVQLLAVRALNDSGSGNLSDVALAIRWAVDHGARVINMSIGGYSTTTPLNEACQYALRNGVLLIAASGNDASPVISYPARLSECVAVGATDEISGIASFSNYGPEQELVAPGIAITSTIIGNGYMEASGTSMACPQVTGVAALILSLAPAMSPAQVRAILAASAIDINTPGWDEYFGYGLVNAARAVALTQTLLRAGTTAIIPAPLRSSTIITNKTLTLPPSTISFKLFDRTGRLLFYSPNPAKVLHLPEKGVFFISIDEADGTVTAIKVIVPR